MVNELKQCDISKFEAHADPIVRILQEASRKLSEQLGYHIQETAFEIWGYEMADKTTKEIRIFVEPARSDMHGRCIRVSATVTEHKPFAIFVPFNPIEKGERA